ncbi:MAG: hypothetical protein M3264_05260 [Thermoproteota archaeon]|nr:hypothetical protein [Thermoproteota archaeon]
MSSNKDFAAISINDSSVSYPPNSKLYFNLGSCNLVLLDAQKEEWFVPDVTSPTSQIMAKG